RLGARVDDAADEVYLAGLAELRRYQRARVETRARLPKRRAQRGAPRLETQPPEREPALPQQVLEQIAGEPAIEQVLVEREGERLAPADPDLAHAGVVREHLG